MLMSSGVQTALQLGGFTLASLLSRSVNAIRWRQYDVVLSHTLDHTLSSDALLRFRCARVEIGL